MDLNSLICFVAALSCGGLGLFVLLRDRHSFVHRTFAAGMLILALEAVFTGLSIQTDLDKGMVNWQRWKLLASALVPGTWLLFTFTFARKDYREFLLRVRWLTVSSFLIPTILVTVFNGSLFRGDVVLDASSTGLIPLGRAGYLLHLILLLNVVIILMTLERTFRVSTGNIRWQIKFMVLGLGSLFVIRIYTGSQTLLFSSVNLGLEVVNAGTLIVACVLMIRSLVRIRMFNLDIYLSHSLIYNSFTVLIIGIYFIVLGVLAKAVRYWGGLENFAIQVFIIFVAFVAISILLFSDRARYKVKRFISHHLKRPQYDYRKEWTTFTQKNSRLLEIKSLCASVVKTVSETFEVLDVTIWLWDESKDQVVLGGSTVFSEGQAKGWKLDRKEDREFIRAMGSQEFPVDIENSKALWFSELRQALPEYSQGLKIRYCVSLMAGGELQGIMTLGERVLNEHFSLEDFDLLKTISVQTAASLLNIKLADRLRQAKEMEAFQTMSSFVVHDLKNVASTLSLTLQNLPTHFNNPEFQEDALRVISQSVTKITTMCSSLSNLSQKMELKRVETNLNELIGASLRYINGSSKAPVIQQLQPVPGVSIDPEQVQKVLINLLLNASEAIENGGEVKIATEQREGWVVLSVNDTGCGMSREFIEKSLFRPFKTTKKQGMGIGLFQSKMIVEAHQGRIEVESEPGIGTTFRVFLPIGQGGKME